MKQPAQHVSKKAQDIKVGDRVDLESCPFLHDHPSAPFEWAQVVAVKQETPSCVAITYEGIDQVGYSPNTVLTVRVKRGHVAHCN